MATALHRARLDAVVSALLANDARHIVDLGCGPGELLQTLQGYTQFRRLLGIDIDARALAKARGALGLDLFNRNERLDVCLGSFEDSDWHPAGVDAAVMLETIEHVHPGRLPKVEQSVFGELAPGLVLVTTPNREYNPLHGMAPGERRHPGHHFEWTREQFRCWAQAVGDRHGYRVDFSYIGPRDRVLGSSTQMASFRKAA
ncbi:MAG: methyltransferase domain-containing protein [Gammaproteobacteria bacterium]|nr:methyltransferase domain-containing protein [Gammaproteobacteria bacterium]